MHTINTWITNTLQIFCVRTQSARLSLYVCVCAANRKYLGSKYYRHRFEIFVIENTGAHTQRAKNPGIGKSNTRCWSSSFFLYFVWGGITGSSGRFVDFFFLARSHSRLLSLSLSLSPLMYTIPVQYTQHK